MCLFHQEICIIFQSPQFDSILVRKKVINNPIHCLLLQRSRTFTQVMCAIKSVNRYFNKKIPTISKKSLKTCRMVSFTAPAVHLVLVFLRFFTPSLYVREYFIHLREEKNISDVPLMARTTLHPPPMAFEQPYAVFVASVTFHLIKRHVKPVTLR